MQEKKFFLLDAYALIFRAYYALIKMPRLRRDGFNTSAIFGFVNTLEELLKKERPTHIAVCFDPPGPTFRHEAFEAYKAQRDATPEDIRRSVPIIKEVVEAYRIPLVEVAGYEADDVIGTLAKKAAAHGFTAYMMTPDKDFGQLVAPNILQYKPAYRGADFELRGEEEVKERYGLQRPEQVIDLLALMGDKIDNIPGCPGIGEKTAVKLISEYGSVDNLLMRSAELKGALKKKIEEHSEDIRQSKFLATICTDVPVDCRMSDFEVKSPDRERLFALFKELEFNALADRVSRRLDAEAPVKAAPSLFDGIDDFETLAPEEEKVEAAVAEWDFKIVNSPKGLSGLCRAIADAAGRIGVAAMIAGDSEAVDPVLGIGVAVDGHTAFYVPASEKEGMALVLDTMARRDIEKICLDSKRDYVAARRMRPDSGDTLENYYDVGLAHYLLAPEGRHSAVALVAEYSDLAIDADYPQVKGKGGLTADSAFKKGCIDACVAYRVVEGVKRDISAFKELSALLNDVELPLAKVLGDMELAGVLIDTAALREASDELTRQLSLTEKEIFSLAGEEFNIGSPAKVGEVLFDHLSLEPRPKKTKSGQYSTTEEVLEKLAGKYPVVGKILECRRLKKLLNTYINALPEAINPATGRVHTTYTQTVTATGRLSSTNPNLQNIPVRDEGGREIRRAFIASPGCVFLSSDYSQIELRLVADFSGDETMIDAFRHNRDIHAITASKIYHEELSDVTATQRRNAKTANFGILYGISAFGLASRLSIPRAEAKQLIDGYFATFPKVREYMNKAIDDARSQGYVSTPMGRRRSLPDILSKNPVVRGYAERNAINAPIQGFAADIIKVAMVKIAAQIKERGLKAKMIMQVHDELNFDVPEAELAEVREIVVSCMESAWKGNVPLEASCGVASNWLDAH